MLVLTAQMSKLKLKEIQEYSQQGIEVRLVWALFSMLYISGEPFLTRRRNLIHQFNDPPHLQRKERRCVILYLRRVLASSRVQGTNQEQKVWIWAHGLQVSYSLKFFQLYLRLYLSFLLVCRPYQSNKENVDIHSLILATSMGRELLFPQTPQTNPSESHKFAFPGPSTCSYLQRRGVVRQKNHQPIETSA